MSPRRAPSSGLFLPVTSSLHSYGFSVQFLLSYPSSPTLSLQLCSSSLQSPSPSIPAFRPKLIPQFQCLHPAFPLSIFMFSMLGSLLDLSLSCLSGCHNTSLLTHVPDNSCLAHSSPQWGSWSQTSVFSQYLLLLPTPIWFLSTASLFHSEYCLVSFFFSLPSMTTSVALPVFPSFPPPRLLSSAPLKILTQPVLVFLLFPTSPSSSPSHSVISFLSSLSLTKLRKSCWWESRLGMGKLGCSRN